MKYILNTEVIKTLETVAKEVQTQQKISTITLAHLEDAISYLVKFKHDLNINNQVELQK